MVLRIILKTPLMLPALAGVALAWAGFELFDGQSLAGWQVHGQAQWSVQDAEIVGSGEDDGFLATEASYADSRLWAEFRIEAGTNSGIFIRCKDREKVHADTCYEFNIWDRHPRQEARLPDGLFRIQAHREPCRSRLDGPAIAVIRSLPVSWPWGSWRDLPYPIGSITALWTFERVRSFLT
jgi:hypothetical protein